MDDTELKRLYRACPVDLDALNERYQQQRRFHRRVWTTTTAGCGVLLALLSAYFVSFPQTYITTVQPQVIELQDGSVAALNADSKLRVEYSISARNLYLEQGQAIFKVRHNARHRFRVHTGLTVVEAIGTQFDVSIARGREVIAVVDGVVKLHPGSSPVKAAAGAPAFLKPIEISAGRSATLRSDGRAPQVNSIDVAAVTAWERSAEQLDYKNQSLAEIASVFNRYNAEPKVRIEGEALRARHFVFTFDDANVKTLLDYLAEYDDLEFVRQGQDILVRQRPTVDECPNC